MKLSQHAAAIAALVLPVLLTACDLLDTPTHYLCKAQGESFHYAKAERRAPIGVQDIAFTLSTYRKKNTYTISTHAAIPESQSSLIVLDKAKSNDVEAVYLLDTIDAATKIRTVSSLVLHRVSGDVRLFHHRWLPPVEWKDSDQYMYSGHCVKATS
jgi:hypothetical protein